MSCPDNLLKVISFGFWEIIFLSLSFFLVYLFLTFSLSKGLSCECSLIYTVELALFLQAQVASAMLGHAKGGEIYLHEIYLA